MKRFGSAVILAGGKSSRMGFDKQNIVIHNQLLIECIVKKLRTIFDEIILITNTGTELKIFDKVSPDIIESQGPLSGIYTGLTLASSEYVYFIACDMPIINEEYIRYMEDLITNEADACVTKYNEWIEPFNAFYKKGIKDIIKEYLSFNRRSIYNLVSNLNTLYIDEKTAIDYSENFEMFFNLNTKDDIKNYIENICLR